MYRQGYIRGAGPNRYYRAFKKPPIYAPFFIAHIVCLILYFSLSVCVSFLSFSFISCKHNTLWLPYQHDDGILVGRPLVGVDGVTGHAVIVDIPVADGGASPLDLSLPDLAGGGGLGVEQAPGAFGAGPGDEFHVGGAVGVVDDDVAAELCTLVGGGGGGGIAAELAHHLCVLADGDGAHAVRVVRKRVAVDEHPVVAEVEALEEALLAAVGRVAVAIGGAEAVQDAVVVQRDGLDAAVVALVGHGRREEDGAAAVRHGHVLVHHPVRLLLARRADVVFLLGAEAGQLGHELVHAGDEDVVV